MIKIKVNKSNKEKKQNIKLLKKLIKLLINKNLITQEELNNIE